ncbi:unnamed protein product [Moneuplotes crassus]|uniref:Uncharacterized protein n=1 Tax=Euplotes crassus TaxID=5936 RepID=A0AAD1UK37_EUPCR|nr:unnamed protein product [Moneuplotes crassus]
MESQNPHCNENSLVYKLRQELISSKSGGNLNYTEKRILKDLEEFQYNVNPEMGISAMPLKDNIYKWVANIRGILDTPYEGGIFHFSITIPQDYPNSPPKVEALTPITNPYFSGTKYLSEMVQSEWCSGYSLFSVLLQIQFGFYDYKKSKTKAIKAQAEETKTFKCPFSDHNGEDNIYPPFESALEDGPVEYAKKTEEEKLIEDTYCFHTRMNVKETIQGTGVGFSRTMRTTEVSRIYTTIDMVSQKAYKEGLRKGVNKKKFSHWLPLYFKETSNVEKTIDLFRKSLSDISAGSKDKFEEEMILQIMPKLLLSHCVQSLTGTSYCSIKGLRMLNYYHRAFVFVLEHHPEMQFKLEQTIENFIHSEKFRGKENTPDIGMILAMICVSKKFTSKDLIKAYFEEKFTRCVFHIIREIPEFETLNDETFSQEFAQNVYENTKNSWELMMFFSFYNSYIIDKNQGKRDLSPIIEEYDKRYSRLYYKLEDEIQKEVEYIKSVSNFNDFFRKVGLKTKTNNEIKRMFYNSVATSRQKGYHGGVEIYFPLPEAKRQVWEVMKDKVTLLSFCKKAKEEEKFMDDEVSFQGYIKSRFPWVKSYLLKDEEQVTPEFLANESDLRNSSNKYHLDLKGEFQNLHSKGFFNGLKNSSSNRPYESYTWKDLFMKLDFETFIYFNEYHQNNKALERYLKFVCPTIKGLVLKQPSRDSDDFSYAIYTKIISACARSLERLVIIGDTQAFPISQGLVTCIRLGFKSAKSVALKELEVHYVNYLDTYGEPMADDRVEEIKLISLLEFVPNIDTLRMSNISLSVSNIDKIFEVIKHENLKELSLVNCSIDKYVAKALAKRMELEFHNLEILNLSHNHLHHGAGALMRRLAGKEHLRVFDISHNCLEHIEEPAKYFGAFLEKTPRLEYLNFAFTNIQNMISASSTCILIFLGKLQNLRGFSFDTNTCKMTTDQLKEMGKAIVESKNSGAPLDYIILRGCFGTYQDYEEFFDSLSVLSPILQEERLHGFELVNDPWQAQPDGLIKYLDISLGAFTSMFEQNQLRKGEFPGLKYVFTIVESLNMNQCQLDEKDARMIKFCLNQAGGNSSLRALNLSKNMIGTKGAKAIASLQISELDLSSCKLGVGEASALSKLIKENLMLKKLNLYNNKVQIEGTRFISKALEENKTLEFLDLGSNLIRNKGFQSLTTCINGSLKVLAVKNNCINEKGFNEFMEAYHNSGDCQLKTLLLASNDINMYTIKLIEEDIGDKLYVDLGLKLDNHNERTLFLCGINPKNTKPLLKKYFEKKGCGVIEHIDIMRGRETKKGKINIFGFVKFAHKNGKMRVIQSLEEFEEEEIEF